MLDDTLAAAPQLWLAAAGTEAGWRRATVSLSLDDGASWQAAGQTAMPAIIGSAATRLGDGPATLFDRAAMVEVELAHGGMALAGATEDALAAGDNLALLGDELLQFGTAEQRGATRWRLSRLVRGRRGTEWATAGHVAGEHFVLLDRAAMLPLAVPLAALGVTARVSALGPGDAGVPADAGLVVAGAALRPPAPVRLTAARRADGAIDIAWTRRSRLGWAWLDGGDTALGEDGERYRLDLVAAPGRLRTVETAGTGFSYTPAQQREDGAVDAPGLVAWLAMLGTGAASQPPATRTWTWQGADR